MTTFSWLAIFLAIGLIAGSVVFTKIRDRGRHGRQRRTGRPPAGTEVGAVRDFVDRAARAEERRGVEYPVLLRKKPVEVVAMRWDGSARNLAAIQEFVGFTAPITVRSQARPAEVGFRRLEDADDEGSGITAQVYDKLHDTWVGVRTGHWVIEGIQGEFYPCADDVLRATYDLCGRSDRG